MFSSHLSDLINIREDIHSLTEFKEFKIVFFYRASIFKVHLNTLKTEMVIDELSRKMAALTPGFSGTYHSHVLFHSLCIKTMIIEYSAATEIDLSVCLFSLKSCNVNSLHNIVMMVD